MCAGVTFFPGCGDHYIPKGFLGAGSYTAAALELLPWKYIYMEAYSITITPGYQVTLYEQDNFTGQSMTVTKDVRCLDNFASSLVIQKGRTGGTGSTVAACLVHCGSTVAACLVHCGSTVAACPVCCGWCARPLTAVRA
jgi:hypothetical protein